MTIHFRREPEMTKRAPPLGYFVHKTTLELMRALLIEGSYADAEVMLRGLLTRTPRMPNKGELEPVSNA